MINEQFTQYSDIEEELEQYKDKLSGKKILCNCNDPVESNFFKYFARHFNDLHLQSLTCTSYAKSRLSGQEWKPFSSKNSAYKIEITTVPEAAVDNFKDLFEIQGNTLSRLEGDGDFRSPECIRLLVDSDIVITSPPVHLYHTFVKLLKHARKDFILICAHENLKDVFTWFQTGELHIGHRRMDKRMKFISLTPNGLEINPKTTIASWITSYPIEKEGLKLPYSKVPKEKFDNFDAINVGTLQKIPNKYEGLMGVPVTILDHYDPEQFDLYDISNYARVDNEHIYIRVFVKHHQKGDPIHLKAMDYPELGINDLVKLTGWTPKRTDYSGNAPSVSTFSVKSDETRGLAKKESTPAERDPSIKGNPVSNSQPASTVSKHETKWNSFQDMVLPEGFLDEPDKEEKITDEFIDQLFEDIGLMDEDETNENLNQRQDEVTETAVESAPPASSVLRVCDDHDEISPLQYNGLSITTSTQTIHSLLEDFNGKTSMNGTLELQPAWHRDYIYTPRQEELLKISVENNLPIGSFIFYQPEPDKLQVLDGFQRLAALSNQKVDSTMEVPVLIIQGCLNQAIEYAQSLSGMPWSKIDRLIAKYNSPWIVQARDYIWGSGKKLAKGTVTGNLLVKALKWYEPQENIEAILARHQFDKNAFGLCTHFRNVLEWANTMFPIDQIGSTLGRSDIDWNQLYLRYKDRSDLDPSILAGDVKELIEKGVKSDIYQKVCIKRLENGR